MNKLFKKYLNKIFYKLKLFSFKIGFHPTFINIDENYYPLKSRCYCSQVLYLEKKYEPALFL